MPITKRKPVSVGEMLVEEFMIPHALTQDKLAAAMGVSRKTVNELCGNKRSITADTALLLSIVFNNTPEFWLNLQQRSDLWSALNTPARANKIKKAVPLDVLIKKNARDVKRDRNRLT